MISVDELFDLAIEECLDAIDRNSPPEITEFLQRFPEIADRLLPALGAIHQVSGREWPRVGDIIDDHRIVQYLGISDLSRVYLTTDEKAGGRATVLKVTTTPTSEAVYLARLNHPSVCTLYQGANDASHLLLQYVDGPNAMTYLTSHANTATHNRNSSAASAKYYRRAVAAIVSVASAIDHIHARGVAHNDIKPPNIVIGESDTLLIDFDAASEIGVYGARRAIGTIDYLSNESLKELARNGQMVGQNCLHDDHFAFAVTCFEILTGTLPWVRHRDEVTPALCRLLCEERWRLSIDDVAFTTMPHALAHTFTNIFTSKTLPPCPVVLARSIASHYRVNTRNRLRIVIGASAVSVLLFATLIILSLPLTARTDIQSTLEASPYNSQAVTDSNHLRPSVQQVVRTQSPLNDSNDMHKDYQKMSAIDESKLSPEDAAKFAYLMFLIKPDHERHARLYEITIANGGPNAAVWNNYGFSLLCSRRPIEARKAFLAAIQLEPDLPQPYLHLAALDEACPGKYGAAPLGVNALSALQRIPEDPIARRLAVSALKSLGAANNGKRESLDTANRLLKILNDTRLLPQSRPISPCVNPTASAHSSELVLQTIAPSQAGE